MVKLNNWTITEDVPPRHSTSKENLLPNNQMVDAKCKKLMPNEVASSERE